MGSFRLRSQARKLAYRLGYQVTKLQDLKTPLESDMDRDFNEIYVRSKPYTMTSMVKMYALYDAIRYLVCNNIPGDIVECGVWKGGSSMVAALTLAKLEDTSRSLWLYDTYAGMSEPDDRDIQIPDGVLAHTVWRDLNQGDKNLWCYSDVKEVKTNMYSTGYPREKIVFVKGSVEDTIPGQVPNQIALLRLDTDWYRSTYHELQHLFPRISEHGVLILDDYGHWNGCREATDTYIEENQLQIYLTRVGQGCRIALKTLP